MELGLVLTKRSHWLPNRWDLSQAMQFEAQRSINAGCSISFLISAKKAAPTAPSMTL